MFSAGFISSNQHCFKKEGQKLSKRVKKSHWDWAWRGDHLNAMMVIEGFDQAIKNLDVKLSDFMNETGEVFSKNNITVSIIKEVDAYIGRGFVHGKIPKEPKEKLGDVIYKNLPLCIEPHEVKSLWLNIDIPANVKPGTYQGSIDIVFDGKASQSLSYSFEVLDLGQPPLLAQDFSMELWQYPYTTARYYKIPKDELFQEKHLSILKEHLKVYKEAGGGSITTTIVEDPWHHQTTDPYPSMVKWIRKKDGRFIYDFTHFDAYIGLALSMDIAYQIKSFSMLPWDNRIIYYDESQAEYVEIREKPGTKIWQKLWGSFIRAYIKHLDEKNLFDITYIALDERPLEEVKHVIDLLEKYPNKEGRTLKIHAAMDYNDVHNPLLDQIDDISINFGKIKHGSHEVIHLSKARRALGLSTTIYTATEDYPNSFAFSDPGESAWILWYALSHQVDGFLRWALDAWVQEPLKDISHWYWESGDPFFIYPSEKEKDYVPYSSPRFEKLKEARRDIAKDQYLSAQGPAYKQKVNRLIASIDRVYGKKNKHGAMTAGSQSNKDFIHQELLRLRTELYQISKACLKEKEAS